MSRFALLFTGILVIVTAGLPGTCHARDLSFSPLFSWESSDAGPSLDGLGPILEITPTYTTLRPIFHRDREQQVSCFLCPLGKITPDHAYFVPFMRWRTEGDNESFDLFPYFSGTYEGKHYHGLFPLYGHVYHRYGFDEATFVLWPLYAETNHEGAVTHTLLWPVFSYRSNELLRVFPLFGTEKTADSTYTYALWPVFHRESRTDGGGMAAALDYTTVKTVWLRTSDDPIPDPFVMR